jgi:murein L,D-transpeptidase YafK
MNLMLFMPQFINSHALIRRLFVCSTTGLILIVSNVYAEERPVSEKPTAEKPTDPIAVQPPEGKVPDNLLWLEPSALNSPYVFIADKENRTLSIWQRTTDGIKLTGAYAMDIGKNVGDKAAPGDAKTPEGTYFVQNRLEGSSLNFNDYGVRAFTLDYPNYFDRLAGKSGSGIWLHAIPETKSLLRGSRGCVVVRNEIIQKITPLVALKRTPVIIVNKVNYVAPEELAANQKQFADWLEGWRAAWQNKDIESYIGHYADNFKGEYKNLKMNKSKWREYKKFLAAKYSHIKVEARTPMVLARKDEAIVRFVQDYESDGLKDIGEKTLYVRKNSAGKYEILTEQWAPVTTEQASASR